MPSRSLLKTISTITAILLLAYVGSQQRQQPIHWDPSTSAPSSSSVSSTVHDLQHDEDMGGHTLRKHVGRTDAQLRERLQHEHEISAASTYTDRSVAELTVSEALEQMHGRVEHWLQREGEHSNLALQYHGSQVIGRAILRDGEEVSCTDAAVVLSTNGGGDFFVLTTYPEPPRQH
ncbi:MAG: hypothetical protein QM796_07080 [Chthoniobacteraceae bacterium]